MVKMANDKKGFTLIELMIVVAIVGILAAISIPAYIQYTIKAKLSEVTMAMDALAQAATEYHATVGCFPAASYQTTNNVSAFAAVSINYAKYNYHYTDNNDCNFIATFTLSSIANTNLIMNIGYNVNNGYSKSYDPTSSIPVEYMPKK
jgi:prepilin-type N-terminal cleavage/methylation domain-containing protein